MSDRIISQHFKDETVVCEGHLIEWGQYSMTSPSQLELERKHEL